VNFITPHPRQLSRVVTAIAVKPYATSSVCAEIDLNKKVGKVKWRFTCIFCENILVVSAQKQTVYQQHKSSVHVSAIYTAVT